MASPPCLYHGDAQRRFPLLTPAAAIGLLVSARPVRQNLIRHLLSSTKIAPSADFPFVLFRRSVGTSCGPPESLVLLPQSRCLLLKALASVSFVQHVILTSASFKDNKLHLAARDPCSDTFCLASSSFFGLPVVGHIQG
ncbi:hypothetical protein CALCODRAFT_215970 [Calocera cornea HHB12733]|uniref:Uncharacterized protein n=1 Tax=Calocera cornea HHB12733 TaxID=1353952 RepID=A0A165HC91_9BASI|nr:hypothetical protein CALCODRAFT_215970 [Calocera cornea HHB12733]